MAKVLSGELDHAVEFELSEQAFDDMEKEGRRPLTADARARIQRLARHVIERREMVRPDASVILQKLSHLITRSRCTPKEFVDALDSTDFGGAEDVAGRVASVVLASRFGPDWRQRLRRMAKSGQMAEEDQLAWNGLWGELSRARDDFTSMHGGRRDGGLRGHDLGWLVIELAAVFQAVGGTVAIRGRSHLKHGRRASSPDEYASPFARFVMALVRHLPRGPAPLPQDIDSRVAGLRFEIFGVAKRQPR